MYVLGTVLKAKVSEEYDEVLWYTGQGQVLGKSSEEDQCSK